jgi:hypothetical protein
MECPIVSPVRYLLTGCTLSFARSSAIGSNVLPHSVWLAVLNHPVVSHSNTSSWYNAVQESFIRWIQVAWDPKRENLRTLRVSQFINMHDTDWPKIRRKSDNFETSYKDAPNNTVLYPRTFGSSKCQYLRNTCTSDLTTFGWTFGRTRLLLWVLWRCR